MQSFNNSKKDRHELNRSRYKRMVHIYAKMLIKGEIDYQLLARLYDRTTKPEYAEVKIKKIIRQRDTQVLLNQEIEDIYENMGITAKSVAKRENELLDLTIDNKNYAVSSKILDNQAHRLGLNPANITKSISVTAKTDYKGMLENKEIKQIEGKKEDSEKTE